MNNLKYWQKGGTIGFFFGIIIFGLASLIYNNSYGYYLLIFPAIFFGNIFIIIWYTVLGILFGITMSYVSMLKKRKIWITISFLILLVLISLLEVAVLYLKGAGKA